MMYFIFALLVLICILTVVCYALLVIASRADERAERMYRKWKEANRGLVDTLKADTICAQNLRTNEWKEEHNERD